MMRGVILFVSFSILVSGVVARRAPLIRTSEAIKEQYIVVLKENAEVSTVLQSLRDESSKKVIAFNNPVKEYTKVLKGFSISLSKEALALVRAHPSVSYVEEDGMVYASETWGLDRINQRDLPLDDSFTPIGNGSGVNVYVLDTGIRTTHEDFEGRAEFSYDAMNYAIGNDGDCHGHGTHCAGTIAGMDWVGSNGIRPAIASMSLGGGGLRSVDESLRNLHNDGVTVVVAAMNNDFDSCAFSPARAPEAITVGAIQDDDARVYFSNWGACVDIFAPGHRILSADYRSDDDYRLLSGTSMACPHVAGVAAIHLGLNPQLSPAHLRDIILESASRDRVTELHDSENLLLYVPNKA